MEFTRDIVNLAHQISIQEIDQTSLIKVKHLIRDGLGVLLLGIDHETIAILKSHFKENETISGVKLIGEKFNTSSPDASFIYGCAIHCMDFEPMFLPPTHVLSPVLSPLIALSQSGYGNSELFLKSFIAGIQFEADLRKAAYVSDKQAATNENHFPFERNGFHPPGTVGPLGSALASSIMLRLDAESTKMAIGMAASRSCGISANIGTQAKSTHCGTAARSGLESALLVRKGISASNNVIESQSGWAQIFGGKDFNYEQLKAGMKNLDCFTNPGFGFKKWPSHTAMQIAISAGLKLYSAGKMPENIIIHSPVFKYCDRPFPRDTDEARFSFQYNVIIAMIDGFVDNNSYTEKKLRSKEVQNALNTTKLYLDKSIPKDFGQMHILIKTSSGQEVMSSSWPGHWATPMSEKQLFEKFAQCTEKYWSLSEAKEVSDLIMNIEDEENYKQFTKMLFGL